MFPTKAQLVGTTMPTHLLQQRPSQTTPSGTRGSNIRAEWLKVYIAAGGKPQRVVAADDSELALLARELGLNARDLRFLEHGEAVAGTHPAAAAAAAAAAVAAAGRRAAPIGETDNWAGDRAGTTARGAGRTAGTWSPVPRASRLARPAPSSWASTL